MTPTEAAATARRIANTWNARWNDEHLDAWAEELEDLPLGEVQEVLRYLRRSSEKPPSIAQFLAAMGHEHAPGVKVKNHCLHCNGNGWVDAGIETRVYDGGAQALTLSGPVVRRCHFCKGVPQARPSYQPGEDRDDPGPREPF